MCKVLFWEWSKVHYTLFGMQMINIYSPVHEIMFHVDSDIAHYVSHHRSNELMIKGYVWTRN